MSARAFVLVAAAGVTLLLYVVPGGRLLARPLVLLATLVHELGHGLAAMLCGGSFERLRMHADASGVAVYQGHFSPLALATIAAAGPLAPPVLGALLFAAAAQQQHATPVLAGFGALIALVALLLVRNLFGIVFALGVGAGIVALALLPHDPRVAPIACAFLGIQMSLAAFARADYLFTAHARTAQGLVPSDTTQIAQALGLPYWFWGALLALVSLAVLAGGLWLVL